MPLYRVRTWVSSRMIYQCDIICNLVIPKKLKTLYCLLILIDLKFIAHSLIGKNSQCFCSYLFISILFILQRGLG
ncbi:hypothetical protein T09_15032 [Trichinella sp. T9]|nr:hypothetical protein T09_15032 [Trichinella sp. T9]